MQLSADCNLSYPLKTVFEAYRDDLVKLVEFLPNIRGIDVKSREETADTVTLVNEWRGGGDIPSAARVVLSESMLSFTDYAIWNAADYTCDWRIETRSFSEAVHCAGKNRFVQVEGGTRVEIRGEIRIDASKIKGVPRLLRSKVSKTVEDFLVKKITPNLLGVSDGLKRYLAKAQA